MQALVVDFNGAMVIGANDALCLDLADLLQDLLIIESGIAHKAHLLGRQQCPRDANRPLDLVVLTEEVGRGVGEPIGVGDGRFRQIDDGGRHRWIATGQAFLAIQSRRGALHHGRDTLDLLRVGLLAR
jgi:hypothetical protein